MSARMAPDIGSQESQRPAAQGGQLGGGGLRAIGRPHGRVSSCTGKGSGGHPPVRNMEGNCDFCWAGYCPEMTAITPTFRHIQNLQRMISRRRWIVKSSAARII